VWGQPEAELTPQSGRDGLPEHRDRAAGFSQAGTRTALFPAQRFG
jgi:hypothetical protein